MDKIVKLVAKEDIDVVNIFGYEKHIKKGEELCGNVREISETFKVVVIDICGFGTPYDMDVAEDKFYIRELDN